MKTIVKSISSFLLIIILSACGGGGGGGDGGGEAQVNQTTPSTPGGLSAQAVSTSQIDLDWKPATDDVAVLGYTIDRNGGTTINTVSTSYSVTGLSPETQYCFSVAAFDGDGNFSAQSASVCATTEAEAPSAWTTVRSGTANELSNVLWTGDKLVVVEENTTGGSTTVHTSTDGLAWSKYPAFGFAFNGAKDVVYGNNQFVAVDGWLFTSPDGITWDLLEADLNFGDARALAWSQTLSLYVAVGDAGYIRTSADGTTWSTVDPAPTANGLYGVAWLNGRFYAVGDAGTILTSTDGLNWNAASTPAYSFALESVAWNGQIYVATGYGTAFTSTDGDTWTEVSAPPSGFNDSVAWGGGSANCFVTVGPSNHIFTSPDGQTWTRRFLTQDLNLLQSSLDEVVWTGTRFVAVGELGTVITSDDGVNWTIATTGSDFEAVAWDGSQFIAVGGYGRYATAPNATDWTYHYLGSDYHFLYDITWSDSLYVGVGEGTIYSADLGSWLGDTGTILSNKAVIFDGSQFVKTDEYGILIWDGVTMHSGTTDPWWEYSLFDSSSYLNLRDIVWTGSQFVAVGDNGLVYTSPDAYDIYDIYDISTSTWTPQTSDTSENLNAIVWSGSQYVAVGSNGVILTSPDALTWTLQSSGTTYQLNDIVWTGSEYYAVGDGGTILNSADGVSWTGEQASVGSDLNGIAWAGTDLVIVGEKGTIIRNN